MTKPHLDPELAELTLYQTWRPRHEGTLLCPDRQPRSRGHGAGAGSPAYQSAFPMMSNAVRVWVSWAVRRTFWARNRATSPRSLADPFVPRVDPRAPPSLDSAPASRARAHSLMWEWYSPSRRSTAPFSPRGADSYSATTANL